MIYCVVPEELAPELYDRLATYYADDPNVKVIIDRRKAERRAGDVLDRAHELLGVTTNNVAEYRGLLLGLRRARDLGAREVDVVNDSELVARQLTGQYRVKHADLKPLHAEAMRALGEFDRWSVRSVPRAQNADADALVNEALDAQT